MFTVLEQIQNDVQQLAPLPPVTPATPTTVKHDDFGYAIPCKKSSSSKTSSSPKNSSTRDAKPVVTAGQENHYAVIDLVQKKLSHEKKATGNCSQDAVHTLQSEAVKSDSTRPAEAVAATPTIAATSDDGIEPYASIDIVMNGTYQKQKMPTNCEAAHVSTKEPECNGKGYSPSVHEPGNVEPMYAEVTKPSAMVTTNHPLTIANDKIEPYATVNIPYKYKTSKKHKAKRDNLKSCTPINAALSNAMCNKATVLTT